MERSPRCDRQGIARDGNHRGPAGVRVGAAGSGDTDAAAEGSTNGGSARKNSARVADWLGRVTREARTGEGSVANWADERTASGVKDVSVRSVVVGVSAGCLSDWGDR